MTGKVVRAEGGRRRAPTPGQYRAARQKGAGRPLTGGSYRNEGAGACLRAARGAHAIHVSDDAQRPTRPRNCINPVVLKLKKPGGESSEESS